MPSYIINPSFPSDAELLQIRQIQESCAKEIAELQDPAEDVVGDLRVCRFLRAKHGDVGAATEWFSEFLKWRVESGMDTDRKEVVGRSPDDFLAWFAKRRNPYLPMNPYAGRNSNGHVISYMLLGRLDPEKFVSHRQIPLQEETRLQFLALEWTLWHLDTLSRQEGRMVYVIKVADFGGMGCDGRKNPIWVADYKNWLFDMMKPMQKYYCEHDALFCVLNAPWIFRAMMAVMSLVMTARQKAKMLVLGDTNTKDVQASLREHVDDTMLAIHGGSMPGAIGAYPLMTAEEINAWYQTRHEIPREYPAQPEPTAQKLEPTLQVPRVEVYVFDQNDADEAMDSICKNAIIEKVAGTEATPEERTQEVKNVEIVPSAGQKQAPDLDDKPIKSCGWCSSKR
eukprot:TRINITY_DN107732_c0_g1_i1.p1 TRINITY_DN107732_c0_g1~~TRINITY_DN107732_c0_g1_i1.p1  ORF type:complete len:396 (+),score=74.59 TRINITY_DN107732_c0_g1_i1:47-1234(+)